MKPDIEQLEMVITLDKVISEAGSLREAAKIGLEAFIKILERNTADWYANTTDTTTRKL